MSIWIELFPFLRRLSFWNVEQKNQKKKNVSDDWNRWSEAVTAWSRSADGRPQFTSQVALARRARPWPAGLSRLVLVSSSCNGGRLTLCVFLSFYCNFVPFKQEKKKRFRAAPHIDYLHLIHPPPPPPISFHLVFFFCYWKSVRVTCCWLIVCVREQMGWWPARSWPFHPLWCNQRRISEMWQISSKWRMKIGKEVKKTNKGPSV